MLKDIPADVWKVAAVSIPILMGFGAPFMLALLNVLICIYTRQLSVKMGL
ncbi:hypothetical protein F404_gp113 [Vibrio phage pVp-1]|uniref:Uncharacterized protein n=1 Tax=Vibrio phage pVp-1 TaxID=1150989 RepID=H6WXK4_9CAUD|nr:hypothetical protein F404_gp113 [Vibrio phage pVp-1]AFB83970.1 hypothetical protein pVp-1_0113 [Vibrio phage pVp-1]